MGRVEVVIPYAPRPEQQRVHEAEDRERFQVVVAHRRFGKTVMAVNRLIRKATQCPKDRPRTAYIAPTYRQGKSIAWDYLRHFAGVIPGATFNESELRCDLPNGSQIRLYGADNPDALRGIYLDDVVLDEAGLMQRRVWTEVIRPALTDRQGSMLAIGTPNGHNLFWDLRDRASQGDGWGLHTFRVTDTHIIAAAELEDARRQMSPEEYAQEFECSFDAAIRGAIYGRMLEEIREQDRITRIDYEPLLPVHTAWDLGMSDATAIWFMQPEKSGDVRVIDFYEARGESLAHYVNVLNAKSYTYGRHILPHDAKVRELGTGRSRLEMLLSLGLRAEIAPNMSLDDGIEAGRVFLRRCWFDAERCKDGLDALANYRRALNTRTEEYMAPLHDWSSHAADAFRYAAVGMKTGDQAKKWGAIKYSNAGIL